jgi:hypothetical protein
MASRSQPGDGHASGHVRAADGEALATVDARLDCAAACCCCEAAVDTARKSDRIVL